MTERGRQDSVVSAALAHADAIRRTLVKRERGRASATCGSKPRRGGSQHPNKREGPPLILDGPIYSTEYWRTWRTRSRAGMHRGGKCDDSPSVSDPTLYWPVYRSSKGKNVSVRCASGFFVNNNNSRAAINVKTWRSTQMEMLGTLEKGLRNSQCPGRLPHHVPYGPKYV